jgi:hypothetical protein
VSLYGRAPRAAPLKARGKTANIPAAAGDLPRTLQRRRAQRKYAKEMERAV